MPGMQQLPPLLGALGLACALIIYLLLTRSPEGEGKVRKIAAAIHLGRPLGTGLQHGQPQIDALGGQRAVPAADAAQRLQLQAQRLEIVQDGRSGGLKLRAGRRTADGLGERLAEPAHQQGGVAMVLEWCRGH